jgi:hypothetical protein
VVGRASNRKKAQRQSGLSSHQAKQQSRADAAEYEALQKLAVGAQALAYHTKVRRERQAAARQSWSGDAEPIPAKAPRWAQGSLGDRFFSSTFLDRARDAPCLATAQIPDAAAISADPAQWKVAADALIRAVVYDDLGLDHPAVSKLLQLLAPIAEAEVAYHEAADAAMYGPGLDWEDDEPEFPEEDGPVFTVGGCALVDAVWAAVGDDPLSDVLGVLVPVLDDAVPGVDGHITADALIAAFATEYRCEQPGDAEVLERIEHGGGDALRNLVAAGAAPPADVLAVGLAMLSALAQLCRSDSASVLQRAA